MTDITNIQSIYWFSCTGCLAVLSLQNICTITEQNLFFNVKVTDGCQKPRYIEFA